MYSTQKGMHSMGPFHQNPDVLHYSFDIICHSSFSVFFFVRPLLVGCWIFHIFSFLFASSMCVCLIFLENSPNLFLVGL